MRVVVATADSGSIKVIDFDKNVDTSIKDSKEPKIATHKLEHGAASSLLRIGEETVAIAHKNGVIATYTINDHLELICVVARGQKDIVGLCHDSQSRCIIVVCLSGEGTVIKYPTSKESAAEQLSKFTVASGLTTFVNHAAQSNVFASSGRDELPEIFKLDYETGSIERIWKAKNPKNTRVDLPEKNLVTCSTFLRTVSDKSVSQAYRFATGTSHGKLRFYDTGFGGRPTHQIECSKYKVNTLAANEETVIVGDSQKVLALWKAPVLMADKSRLLGHYAGVSGSTRALSTHNGLVAAGGLDRYVRVYTIASRSPAGKIYIGEEVVELILMSDDAEDLEQEDDQLWSKLNGSKRRNIGPSLESQSHSESDSAEAEAESSEGSESDAESSDDETFSGFED